MFHEKEVYVSLCLAVIAVMLMFWDIKANSKGKKIAMTALALSSLAMCIHMAVVSYISTLT